MNKRSLGALIALNIVLLAAVVLLALTPPQAAAQGGGRSQYVLIPADNPARNNTQVVYILELRSGKLLATLFNSADKTFQVLGGRVITNDIQAAAGAGGR